MDKSEQNEAKGWCYAQKDPFPTNYSNWGNIKQNFADSLTVWDNILESLAKSFSILQHSMVFNEILQYLKDIKHLFHPISFTFAISLICNFWTLSILR